MKYIEYEFKYEIPHPAVARKQCHTDKQGLKREDSDFDRIVTAQIQKG